MSERIQKITDATRKLFSLKGWGKEPEQIKFWVDTIKKDDWDTIKKNFKRILNTRTYKADIYYYYTDDNMIDKLKNESLDDWNYILEMAKAGKQKTGIDLLDKIILSIGGFNKIKYTESFTEQIAMRKEFIEIYVRIFSECEEEKKQELEYNKVKELK
jgi:hypothetical protein